MNRALSRASRRALHIPTSPSVREGIRGGPALRDISRARPHNALGQLYDRSASERPAAPWKTGPARGGNNRPPPPQDRNQDAGTDSSRPWNRPLKNHAAPNARPPLPPWKEKVMWRKQKTRLQGQQQQDGNAPLDKAALWRAKGNFRSKWLSGYKPEDPKLAAAQSFVERAAKRVDARTQKRKAAEKAAAAAAAKEKNFKKMQRKPNTPNAPPDVILPEAVFREVFGDPDAPPEEAAEAPKLPEKRLGRKKQAQADRRRKLAGEEKTPEETKAMYSKAQWTEIQAVSAYDGAMKRKQKFEMELRKARRRADTAQMKAISKQLEEAEEERYAARLHLAQNRVERTLRDTEVLAEYEAEQQAAKRDAYLNKMEAEKIVPDAEMARGATPQEDVYVSPTFGGPPPPPPPPHQRRRVPSALHAAEEEGNPWLTELRDKRWEQYQKRKLKDAAEKAVKLAGRALARRERLAFHQRKMEKVQLDASTPMTEFRRPLTRQQLLRNLDPALQRTARAQEKVQEKVQEKEPSSKRDWKHRFIMEVKPVADMLRLEIRALWKVLDLQEVLPRPYTPNLLDVGCLEALRDLVLEMQNTETHSAGLLPRLLREARHQVPALQEHKDLKRHEVLNARKRWEEWSKTGVWPHSSATGKLPSRMFDNEYAEAMLRDGR